VRQSEERCCLRCLSDSYQSRTGQPATHAALELHAFSSPRMPLFFQHCLLSETIPYRTLIHAPLICPIVTPQPLRVFTFNRGNILRHTAPRFTQRSTTNARLLHLKTLHAVSSTEKINGHSGTWRWTTSRNFTSFPPAEKSNTASSTTCAWLPSSPTHRRHASRSRHLPFH
jgi:hypothetical protein